MRKLIPSLLCLALTLTACDDNSTSTSDSQTSGTTSNAADTSILTDSFIQSSNCASVAQAGQTTTSEIVGAWQRCEGPRDSNVCGFLDDDGFIFRTNGTFSITEAARGGSLAADAKICEQNNKTDESGIYVWNDNKLTLVFANGTISCERPFTISSDNADYDYENVGILPYLRIDPTRSCGTCGEYTLPDGTESRCPL